MKRKIKTLLVKYEKVIVLLFIIISVMTFSFNIALEANDELWNFSNIYKMANGYTIYKDLNVIITPLFFYIGSFIFKIMGSNYFIFRVYNVLIFSIFYFLIYEIYRTLKIKANRSMIYLIITYIITYDLIMVGASYNTLAISFCLLGILMILKNKHNWIQGIVIFLIFMTKQSIGIYYTLGYIIYQLVKYKDIKKTIKEIITPGMITIIIITIYYAFLGIKEFGKENFIYDEGMYILLFIVLMYPILIWMMTFRKLNISQDIKDKAYLLICFGIPSLLIAYPLMEGYHVTLASILTIITFVYGIEKSFLEELQPYVAMKIYHIIL